MNRIQTELLLRKAQSGDTGALDTLITAYYPQILNYCRWHTADEQQAQDAAQETFLKAVRWLDSCGGFQGAFRPFLYKIAKNICIDLNRTMERTEVSLENLPGEPAYQESGFAAAEEKANLRALTAQLEPDSGNWYCCGSHNSLNCGRSRRLQVCPCAQCSPACVPH